MKSPPSTSARNVARLFSEGMPLSLGTGTGKREGVTADIDILSGVSGPMDQTPRVAAAYDAHYEALRFIAAQRFRIPSADVRPLIHDVFVAYIRHVAVIGDDRGWLITATKHACLNYWRDVKPGVPLPEEDGLLDTDALRDDVAVRLDIANVLRRVPKGCRDVLLRRYVDGADPGDIAAALSRNRSSGRQIVHRCLEKARAALASFRRGRA